MADIMKGRYALADPSSGLTVVNMEGGEINMFGSCTRIKTTQRESYPKIDDEPTMLKVENDITEDLLTGLVISAAFGCVAAVVQVTEGSALEPLICALGGIAIKASVAVIGTAVSDSQTGYNRIREGYLENLMTGGGTGYAAGASVYGLRAAVPAVSVLAGTQAGRMPGTSNFTADMVPDIAVAGYVPADARKAGVANDICSDSSVYKAVLDKVFNKDVDAYETVTMALAMSVGAYTNPAQNNLSSENRKNDSDEEGLFLEPLSDHYGDEKKNRKEGREYKRFKKGRHIGQNKWGDKKFDADGKNLDRWDSFKVGSTAGWYLDIAPGTAPGSATDEIFVQSTRNTDKTRFPDIYVYDGLPWEPDSNTYFFDLIKAREDVWPLYEKAGVSKGMDSSMLMSSPVEPAKPDSSKLSEVAYEGQYAAIIDGIPALGVGVWPAMWKNYYLEDAMKTIEMDGITANWTYKMAIVVVDKGEDASDPSKWKYVPATRISSKAHTFYGGVMQTNVKLIEGEIILSKSDSGQRDNISVGDVSSYGSDEASIVQMLKDIMAKGGHLGDWWIHYVETFNIEKNNMDNINHNYDFVGYVIYGDTFMNMS